MQIQFKSGSIAKKRGATVVFLFQEDNIPLEKNTELAIYKDSIETLLKNNEFKATFLAGLPLKINGDWLFVVGLGAEDELTPARMLQAAALAAKMAMDRNSKNLDMILPSLRYFLPADVLEAATTGCLLATYRQSEFKSEKEPEILKTVNLWSRQPNKGAETLKKAEISAKAVLLARHLGDTPPNILYPQSFADKAKKLAKPLKLKVRVMDEKALAAAKMNFILAVGSGSPRGPRLVTIKYQGSKPAAKPIILVGKGITFDSGGMSLKPSGSLEGMKTDMAGAATVLAVTLAVAEMRLPLNLLTLIPLAENMPDGKGFRVGDVLTGRSGQTVEVTNTDAEGRLVLADSLALAAETEAAEIIDVATLTGACVVALGDSCAGLFSDNDKLRTDLLAAARSMGENFWPLPLLKDYEELLKSETADMISANTTPKGGAINAALFLKRFASKNTPWAHLDIAGPARASKAKPGTAIGASGFAVRTLIRHLANKSPEQK